MRKQGRSDGSDDGAGNGAGPVRSRRVPSVVDRPLGQATVSELASYKLPDGNDV
jgi:hypothetical protein